MPEKCEALLPYKITKPGTKRIVYDFEGRKVDLGPGVVDSNEEGEVTLSCKRCSLIGGTFKGEGMGYSALNQTKEKAVAFLRENCGKWAENVERERKYGSQISNTPPDSFLPSY